MSLLWGVLAQITPLDPADACSCAWLSYLDRLYSEFTLIADKHHLYAQAHTHTVHEIEGLPSDEI